MVDVLTNPRSVVLECDKRVQCPRAVTCLLVQKSKYIRSLLIMDESNDKDEQTMNAVYRLMEQREAFLLPTIPDELK